MLQILRAISVPHWAKFRLPLAIILLSNMAPTLAVADRKDPEADNLLRQAEQLTDIRSPGSSSFHLTATVRLFDDKGAATGGTYELLWKSPTVWRDEIKVPGFSQTRVAATDRIHILREPRWLPFEIFELRKLLEFPRSIRWSDGGVGLKLRERTKSGVHERSIEILFDGHTLKRLYLDWNRGIPTKVEYVVGQEVQQFQDYMEFSGHQFPRSLAAFHAKKPVMEVRITELTSGNFEESSFTPPPGAGWMHWCPDMVLAKPKDINEEVLTFSSAALRNPVVIDGIIGVEGKWLNLVVVKSGGTEADAFWLDMLGKERYLPARCGNTPVEEEMVQELRLP